jgi:hypothetical protein
MLSNPAYTGLVVFNRRIAGHHSKRAERPKEEWILIQGSHEVLVDKETFSRVQDELKRRGLDRRPGELKTHRKFAGMVQCAHCGETALSVTGTSRWGKLYFYYACRTRTTKSKALCPGLRVRADALEGLMTELIDKRIFSDESIDSFVAYAQAKARELDNGKSHEKIRIQRKLEAIEGKLRKVVLMVEDDVIDPAQAKQRTKELQAERTQLMQDYAKIEDGLAFKSMVPTKTMLLAVRNEMRRIVGEADSRVQRNFYRRFIKSIKTDGKTAEVTYNLGSLMCGDGVRDSGNVSGP